MQQFFFFFLTGKWFVDKKTYNSTHRWRHEASIHSNKTIQAYKNLGKVNYN